jgi:hypothetical protein
MKKFFTTGYTGKNVEQLPALLTFHGAVLADIRFAPRSRHLQWTKNYLSLMLKDRYRHVPALATVIIRTMTRRFRFTISKSVCGSSNPGTRTSFCFAPARNRKTAIAASSGRRSNGAICRSRNYELGHVAAVAFRSVNSKFGKPTHSL